MLEAVKVRKEEQKVTRVFGSGSKQSRQFAFVDRMRNNKENEHLHTDEAKQLAAEIGFVAEKFLFHSPVHVDFNVTCISVKIEYAKRDRISRAGIDWEYYAAKLVKQSAGNIVFGKPQSEESFIIKLLNTRKDAQADM
jgi:hypothetical protein